MVYFAGTCSPSSHSTNSSPIFLIGCAANLALQGGVKSADGAAVRFGASVRRLLLLDVLPDNGDRRTTTATGKVGWRP